MVVIEPKPIGLDSVHVSLVLSLGAPVVLQQEDRHPDVLPGDGGQDLLLGALHVQRQQVNLRNSTRIPCVMNVSSKCILDGLASENANRTEKY